MNQELLHNFRKQIDACIKTAQTDYGCTEEVSDEYKRRMTLVLTHLQEGKMWVGKCLEEVGSELPKEFRDEAK